MSVPRKARLFTIALQSSTSLSFLHLRSHFVHLHFQIIDHLSSLSLRISIEVESEWKRRSEFEWLNDRDTTIGQQLQLR